MRYLLDVSALLALGFQQHEFFERVVAWVQILSSGKDQFVTCAITELGFVRILSQQVPAYGLSVAESKVALARLKASSKIGFDFIADGHGASLLPAWVKTSKQTTDGHLVQLAKTNGAVLATLDRNIPGAFVIPEKA